MILWRKRPPPNTGVDGRFPALEGAMSVLHKELVRAGTTYTGESIDTTGQHGSPVQSGATAEVGAWETRPRSTGVVPRRPRQQPSEAPRLAEAAEGRRKAPSAPSLHNHNLTETGWNKPCQPSPTRSCKTRRCTRVTGAPTATIHTLRRAIS
jgi:hypothetical protein